MKKMIAITFITLIAIFSFSNLNVAASDDPNGGGTPPVSE